MSRPAKASRRGREIALAALFFLAVTALMTWPQAARLNDGMNDVGDAKLTTRILQWDFRQTFRDPANLYQLNFFHPSRYVLAFSENLFGVALFGFPVLAAGASPLANQNLMLLLGMFLSALSAWALARYVTGDPLASVVAGLVYAFVPWRFSQLPHIQFQWGAFLCLLLLFLLRYLDHGRTRDAVLFGVAFAWNALCNVHYALFGALLVGLTLLLYAVENRHEAGRRVRVAILAAALGGLVFVPFALPYRTAHRLYGMKRYFGEMDFYSGRWGNFLSAGDKNRLYGPATGRWRAPEGDFFPGSIAVALAGIALARERRKGGPAPESSPDSVSRARRRAARAVDGAIAVLAALWLLSHWKDGLELGPLRLRDPGRIQVFLTLAVLGRLALAFPRSSRYADLGDFWRRRSLDRRALLLLAIGILSVVVALGANTPYYRFLFQSFGDVFRAIRSPARGIVLFHLALGVLAAWGLARLLRRRTRAVRLAVTAVAVFLILVEYRAFPLAIEDVAAEAPPVYSWLRGTDFPGAAVEWPLGFQYDFEYVFRQTAHEKPLVNGSSGFFPKTYANLEAQLKLRPIPDSVWKTMGGLGASVLVYHAHEKRGIGVLEYARALERGLASGKAELIGIFPHDDGPDFVFRLADGPAWIPPPGGEGRDETARFQATVQGLADHVGRLAPPFAGITFPEPVSPGQWHGGWALDDSGIAEIRIVSELGPVGSALLHMKMPGLFLSYPDYPEARNDAGGFGFAIPKLPPGPHTLTFTLIANDGGVTVLSRRIVVLPK
ncbi:MAG: hypothetical protein WAU32_10860 [Thermoanaerobaculia bacterium]